MRVFLSWSGQQSRQVALALRDWLKNLFPVIEPWMSEKDISMGSRWAQEVGKELEQSNACILCLTPDNLNSPWLHFEAGGVAKIVGDSLVCPFLLGVQKSELIGPLSQFQAAVAERDDTLQLVRTLNTSLGLAIDENRLDKIFNVWWPELDSELKRIDLNRLGSVDRARQGIAALIQSSSLPMYFFDQELVVQDCNDDLASLLNSPAKAIIGRSVRFLIERFGQRVPTLRRSKFLENNLALADMIASDLGPHLEATEYIDNRNLIGNRYARR